MINDLGFDQGGKWPWIYNIIIVINKEYRKISWLIIMIYFFVN